MLSQLHYVVAKPSYVILMMERLLKRCVMRIDRMGYPVMTPIALLRRRTFMCKRDKGKILKWRLLQPKAVR